MATGGGASNYHGDCIATKGRLELSGQGSCIAAGK